MSDVQGIAFWTATPQFFQANANMLRGRLTGSKHLFLSIEKAERLNARLILLFAVQIDFYAEIFVRKE